MTFELVYRVDADSMADVRDLANEFALALNRAHQRDIGSYPCRIVGHRICGPLSFGQNAAAKHREDLGARR